MSNEIQVFRNHEINVAIRTVLRNGEPWFVSVDVCTALGFANPRQAVATHTDSDERGVHLLDTPSSQQQMSCVSEAGVYRLIFGSRKPEAKAFQRWVTHEVLPSIRKTGSYSVAGPRTLLEYAEAFVAAEKARIAAEDTSRRAVRAVAHVKQQVLALEQDLADAAPKVDFADRISVQQDEHTLREAAHLLHYKERQLGAILLADGMLYRSQKRLMAKALYLNRGWFVTRMYENEWGSYPRTLVTRKGLYAIASRYGRHIDADKLL